MTNIEVEVRSFVTPKKIRELRQFLDKNAEFTKEGFDETVYFNGPKDLRIRRDGNNAYIILKEGRMHDDHRKEIEATLPRDEFADIEALLSSLGFGVAIRWYRTRRVYKWKGATVYLWVTKGYGYMIELEKMSAERNKQQTHKRLRKLLASLGVEETPKDVFEERFAHYSENWKKLTRGGPKKPVLPR